MGQQIIHPVDIETVELRVFNRDTPDATVEEFYRFGQILFSECLQRGSEADRKLTTILGWSAAGLAFVLFNHSKAEHMGVAGVVVLIIAALSALVGTATAAIALKTRTWPAPSEDDWFRDELWGDASKMKRFHVVSLLLSHQEHVKNIVRKAAHLRRSELLLLVNALAIGAILLSS